MAKYFGTDGIRGIVNEDLFADLAFKVGKAVAIVLDKENKKKPLITIGKDTRISCDMLEAALTAGLCSAGANVMKLGIVPTPAVAYITRERRADAGIVISASHNPYEHNGIKIFSGDGFKLSDELESRIEYLIDNAEEMTDKTDGAIGKLVSVGMDFVEAYCGHVASAAFGPIADLEVLIDCANGAASTTVNNIFGRFPINIEFIRNHPNGVNINDACGSTNTAKLSRMVVAGGFDLGIAFDGDADRCIVVDEKGAELDGDKIMGICGAYMRDIGKLAKSTIVATVMSNIGFHDYVREHGIELHCTKVGDRQVLEKMIEGGYNLGGEQSGHIIFLDEATTGDGQLAAVKFLSVVCARQRPVSEIADDIKSYPQVLRNLRVSGGNEIRSAIIRDDKVVAAISEENEKLGHRGRVLVRESGTEPLIRVMVEAETEKVAEACVARLLKLMEKCERSLIK